MVHADLPLIDAASVELVTQCLDAGQWVVCPSLDGGTNAIAGFGPFEFSYGPGSFTRHLAMIPDATVIVSPSLAIEVDTVEHFRALSKLGYVSTLAR